MSYVTDSWLRRYLAGSRPFFISNLTKPRSCAGRRRVCRMIPHAQRHCAAANKQAVMRGRWLSLGKTRLSGPVYSRNKLGGQDIRRSTTLFQFALERRTRREAADSAVARQGEATQLSFLMRIGISRHAASARGNSGCQQARRDPWRSTTGGVSPPWRPPGFLQRYGPHT